MVVAVQNKGKEFQIVFKFDNLEIKLRQSLSPKLFVIFLNRKTKNAGVE